MRRGAHGKEGVTQGGESREGKERSHTRGWDWHLAALRLSRRACVFKATSTFHQRWWGYTTSLTLTRLSTPPPVHLSLYTSPNKYLSESIVAGEAAMAVLAVVVLFLDVVVFGLIWFFTESNLR